MSVHGMKPHFVDGEGYRAWRNEWRSLYAVMSDDIHNSKHTIKARQRAGGPIAELMREHRHKRVMARKLMTVLEEAKIRWGNLQDIKKSLVEQNSNFPLTVENCRNIDFHFNKKSLELPFIPMWVIKAKGKTWYCNHVDCDTPWTTREQPDNPSTKGAIRIKRGNLHITAEGDAIIS